MSPDALYTTGSILTLLILLSIMTQSRLSPKKTIIILGSGSMMILAFNTVMLPVLNTVVRHPGFLVTVLAPTYVLFWAIARLRQMRFAYTFLFCLSIAVFLNTLTALVTALNENLYWALVCSGTLLVMISCLLILKYRKLYFDVQEYESRDWMNYMLTPLLGMILLYHLADGPLTLHFSFVHLELKLIIFTILLISHVLVYLDIQKNFVLSDLEYNNRVLETMMVKLREDLGDLIDKIRITKLHRHDLHHHLAILSASAHAQNLADFDDYIEKLKARVDEAAILQYCANFSLNAVLSIYLKKASDQRIFVKTRIDLPEDLSIEDIDLAMILANAIENAIHANLLLDEKDRRLSLTVETSGHVLTIVAENPIQGSLSFADGLPKAKNRDHGFGTLGIRRMALRHHGQAHFIADKGIFTLIVQLPL